jgi:hypothetical protein
MTAAALATIPILDARRGGPVRHAIEGRERARALRDACVTWLPRGAAALLPAMDAVTRAWLKRSCSPYVADVEAIAQALGFSGIWFLNGCYQWGCTTVAREEAGVPWLVRTLDWPFPGLGRHLEIAQLHGRAGDFDAVTWPGYVGALTASAPGRFAGAINQAPMWRRTLRPWLRPLDILLNAVTTWGIRFIPPDHLLRETFECCGSYDEARHHLETTPVARPVIYTLVGCAAGERCVIERTEQGFLTRTDETATANDWFTPRPHWEARLSAAAMFNRSYEETTQNSRIRREELAAFSGQFASGGFDWVTPPVLNPYTRLAVEMCPASGTLRAMGYELSGEAVLPQPVARTSDRISSPASLVH